MHTFTVKTSGVPAGNYRAKFPGVEDTVHVEYGPGLRFVFEVLAGAQAGQKASRVTAVVPTVKKSAGRMLAGLAGRPLKPEDEVDVDQFIGKEFLITVEEVSGDATRVANVVLPKNV